MKELIFCMKVSFYLTMLFASVCVAIAFVMAIIEVIVDKIESHKGDI